MDLSLSQHWNRWHVVARKFKPLEKRNIPPEKCISFADTYHGKVLRLEEAREIITVNKVIEVDDLEQVIPFQFLLNETVETS